MRTNAKYDCITAKGVNLWNNCTEEMKTCRTLHKFKQIFDENNTKNRMNKEVDWDNVTCALCLFVCLIVCFVIIIIHSYCFE